MVHPQIEHEQNAGDYLRRYRSDVLKFLFCSICRELVFPKNRFHLFLIVKAELFRTTIEGAGWIVVLAFLRYYKVNLCCCIGNCLITECKCCVCSTYPVTGTKCVITIIVIKRVIIICARMHVIKCVTIIVGC